MVATIHARPAYSIASVKTNPLIITLLTLFVANSKRMAGYVIFLVSKGIPFCERQFADGLSEIGNRRWGFLYQHWASHTECLLDLIPISDCAIALVAIWTAIPDSSAIFVSNRAAQTTLNCIDLHVILERVDRQCSIPKHVLWLYIGSKALIYIYAYGQSNLKTTKRMVR
jgi:hypothetical protein